MHYPVKKHSSSIDRIIQSYYDPDIELNPADAAVRERIITAQAQLVKGLPTYKIVEFLKNEFGIKQAQAYRDIRNAGRVYGDVLAVDKKALRARLIEMSLQVYELGLKNEDSYSMDLAIGRIHKIARLDEEDKFNPADFEGHEYKVTIPKEMKQLLKMAVASGAINLDEIVPIEEVDYEEVRDD